MTVPKANAAPRILLVTVGENFGPLLAWQRANKVRTFDKIMAAPKPYATPARRDYPEREYPEVIGQHFERETLRAQAFILDVAGQSFDYDRVVVVLDKVAMAYDPKAKLYPTVAGGDIYCALRDMADDVIDA